jgi:hypothetical protein
MDLAHDWALKTALVFTSDSRYLTRLCIRRVFMLLIFEPCPGFRRNIDDVLIFFHEALGFCCGAAHVPARSHLRYGSRRFLHVLWCLFISENLLESTVLPLSRPKTICRFVSKRSDPLSPEDFIQSSHWLDAQSLPTTTRHPHIILCNIARIPPN